MKIKAGKLKSLLGALQSLLLLRFKVAFSYKLSRTIKIVSDELVTFEKERKRLVDQFGERDEKGRLVEKKEGAQTSYTMKDKEGFNTAFEELSNQDVELNIELIKLEEFGEVKVTPMDLLGLAPILDTPSEDA